MEQINKHLAPATAQYERVRASTLARVNAAAPPSRLSFLRYARIEWFYVFALGVCAWLFDAAATTWFYWLLLVCVSVVAHWYADEQIHKSGVVFVVGASSGLGRHEVHRSHDRRVQKQA